MIRELMSACALFAALGVIGIGMAYVAGSDELMRWSELLTAAGCFGTVVLFCVDAICGAT